MDNLEATGSPERLGRGATLELPVSPESKAKMANLVTKDDRAETDDKEKKVTPVIQAQKAQSASQVTKVLTGRKAHLAAPEKMAPQANKGTTDLQACLAKKVIKEKLVTPVLQVKMAMTA